MRRLLAVVARLAVVIVTCGVVYGIGSFVVLRPGQQLSNAKLEDELNRLERGVNEGRAAKRVLPLFREEVKRLEEEAAELLSTAPAGGGISELPSQLRRIASASGVSLQDHAPSTAAGEESEIAARVTVRGSTRQVLAFFAALRDDAYPLLADDLRLSPVEDARDVLQADLVVTSPPEDTTTSP